MKTKTKKQRYRVHVEVTCTFKWFRDVIAESPELARRMILGPDDSDRLAHASHDPFRKWIPALPPKGWGTLGDGGDGDGLDSSAVGREGRTGAAAAAEEGPARAAAADRSSLSPAWAEVL